MGRALISLEDHVIHIRNSKSLIKWFCPQIVLSVSSDAKFYKAGLLRPHKKGTITLNMRPKIKGFAEIASLLPMSSFAGSDSANLPASSSSCSSVFCSVAAFEEELEEDGTGSTSIFGRATGFSVVVGSGPKAVGWLLQLSVLQLRKMSRVVNWRRDISYQEQKPV